MIHKLSRWQKIKSEAITIWVLSFYFAVFFIAISYFRFAILQKANVPYTDFYLGVVKALVCAKFLTIAKAVYPIRITDGKAFVWHILGRSILYVVAVTILIAIEEAIVAKFHGKHILNGITGIEHGTLNLFFALELLYWLMVIPYVTYSALAQSLGENRLRKLIFGR